MSLLLYVRNRFLILSFFLLLLNGKRVLINWNIRELVGKNLDLLVLIDWISLVFFFTLCLIVSCVLKFSRIYMEGEKFFERFHYLVYCFVFSMVCLIFFPHFFFMLVGWDGLGITSFLLVIYYLRGSSWAAGMKTYLINRLGDGLFLVALGLLLIQGHWDIKGVDRKRIYKGFIIVLILGCFTKRAQFPFSRWLPAAMAAPTPVSSLVHSSTLVTAGVYILVRFKYIIPNWGLLLIGLLGLWTLYRASLAACFEWDAKKIVAFSTLRQLGFMVVSISLGLSTFAFFHLVTHAMFKAMMFICVGYLMVKKNHFQDLRSLSGMWKCRPVVRLSLIMRRFSLMGIPFMSGFFSKELIVETNLFVIKEVYFQLLLFSLPLTSFYACRLVFNLLNGKGYNVVSRKNDKNIVLMSLLPLFIGRIVVGNIMRDRFLRISSLYPCHLFKVQLNLFILSGVILALFRRINNSRRFSWFSSEIAFIKPFKGNYWLEKGRKIGEDINYLFDQGNIRKMIASSDRNLLRSGSSLRKIKNYFRSPKMSMYILIILRIILLNWCLI